MSEFGAFDGPIDVRFHDDGRRVLLLAPAGFTDPGAQRWLVPAGTTVDGASIPRAFWSVIGGPFEGRYRDASIIHDYYCDQRTRAWKLTHRVFYNGMRARDVNPIQAKIMYYAVYHFGPRWPPPGLRTLEQFQLQEAARINAPDYRAIVVQGVADYRDAPEVAAAVAAIEANDPSLEEIEAMGA